MPKFNSNENPAKKNPFGSLFGKPSGNEAKAEDKKPAATASSKPAGKPAGTGGIPTSVNAAIKEAKEAAANAAKTAEAVKPAAPKPSAPQTTEAPKAAKKPVDAIVQEVIHGDWGNGADRKAKLEAAGYDYNAVQARVNQLLK